MEENKSLKADKAVSAIQYQYTAIPTHLMLILDNNCRSMLFTLIQLSTFFADKDGYFYRSNELLQLESDMSKNLVIATMDTLYIHEIIDVISIGSGKGRKTNRIRVNFKVFKMYEDIKIDTILNDPSARIRTVSYKGNYSPSYLKCNQKCKKVNTNIDNINNIDNKEYNIKEKNKDISGYTTSAHKGCADNKNDSSIIVLKDNTSTCDNGSRAETIKVPISILDEAKSELTKAETFKELDSVFVKYKPQLKELGDFCFKSFQNVYFDCEKKFYHSSPAKDSLGDMGKLSMPL